jgi:hypothetical protein
MLMLILACATQDPVLKIDPESEPKEEIKEHEMEPSAPEIAEEEENRPPEITSATFTVEKPTTNDEIRLEVEAVDPEGWSVRFDYSWKVNGKPYPAETREFLRKTKVKKGDKIEVLITASDDKKFSEKSLEITVSNAPPEWVNDPRKMSSIDGFVVKAEDPDGDRITYKLEGQPKGMKISSSGKLSYVGSKDEPGGQYKTSVIAEDTDRAQVKYVFDITLSAGSGASK